MQRVKLVCGTPASHRSWPYLLDSPLRACLCPLPAPSVSALVSSALPLLRLCTLRVPPLLTRHRPPPLFYLVLAPSALFPLFLLLPSFCAFVCESLGFFCGFSCSSPHSSPSLFFVSSYVLVEENFFIVSTKKENGHVMKIFLCLTSSFLNVPMCPATGQMNTRHPPTRVLYRRIQEELHQYIIE